MDRHLPNNSHARGGHNGRIKITPTPPSPVDGEGYREGGYFHIRCLIIFITVTAVVLLDQATKAGIASKMLLHDSSIIIEGLLNITYVRNPGAAFGFLSNASPVFRSVFFILITVSAIGLIFYYIAVSKEDETCLIFALSLILGGAVGNLIDRVRFGEVVDFIDVYWKTYHWPAFNVADAAISIGAFIMIFEMLRRKKKNVEAP